MRRTVASYLRLVQFENTVFALPFALTGAVLAARGRPALASLVLVIAAVSGLRTAAMAFNRLADRHFDAHNPRTASRALVTGEVSVASAWALCAAGLSVFFAAAGALGPAVVVWAPLFAALALGYSYTKRVTDASHLVLGAALSLAPLGGWLAAAGTARGYPVALSLAVALWVAGFDVVYACQDEEVDRALGLRSLPRRWGAARALRAAGALHAAALAALVAVGFLLGLGWPYHVAMAIVAAVLVLEHRAVTAGDLSRIRFAFFTANGLVSLAVLAGVVMAVGVAG